MRKGKMCAQAAHASGKAIIDLSIHNVLSYGGQEFVLVPLNEHNKPWLTGSFTKPVVSVSSEVELLEIYEKALAAGIPCSLIQDNGKTEFHGIPTYTAVAVGPAAIELVDPITGHLPLL